MAPVNSYLTIHSPLIPNPFSAMQPSPLHHLLYSWPILIVLGAVFALLIALIELNVLRYAYERMGVSRRYVFLLLFASLAGSYVNIPVAKVTEKHVEPRQFIRRF